MTNGNHVTHNTKHRILINKTKFTPYSVPPAQAPASVWGIPSVELDHHPRILFPKALGARSDSVALRRLFLFPLDCIARRYHFFF